MWFGLLFFLKWEECKKGFIAHKMSLVDAVVLLSLKTENLSTLFVSEWFTLSYIVCLRASKITRKNQFSGLFERDFYSSIQCYALDLISFLSFGI